VYIISNNLGGPHVAADMHLFVYNCRKHLIMKKRDQLVSLNLQKVIKLVSSCLPDCDV